VTGSGGREVDQFEEVDVEDVWGTVDRLIHDLGAIRAFLDEAAAVPELSEAPQVADVRGAMDEATEAISRVLTDSQDRVVEAAWLAIAHAQDAIVKARAVIAAARAKQQDAEAMREQNRLQYDRAREQAHALADQVERLRRSPPSGRRFGATTSPKTPDPRNS
jgi:hypothetical protein